MAKPNNDIPRLSKTLLNKRRAELNRLHKIYSWRKIAKEIYGDEIKFGTLERIAKDKTYIPKDVNILNALEVMVTPSPYRVLPKWYKRIPEALGYFQSTRHKIKEMYDEAKRQAMSIR